MRKECVRMSDGQALTNGELWAMVACDDVSENVHTKVMGLITHRGGIDESVLQAARGEVDLATARIRLWRTMLGTPMFDPIRGDAERMIGTELDELEAIIPELIEAHRRSVEQQAKIAEHMAEVNRITMEGMLERGAIQRKIASDQATMFDEQMARDREASNKRHDLFMHSFRGSR
jgi:hypothetical protein